MEEKEKKQTLKQIFRAAERDQTRQNNSRNSQNQSLHGVAPLPPTATHSLPQQPVELGAYPLAIFRPVLPYHKPSGRTDRGFNRLHLKNPLRSEGEPDLQLNGPVPPDGNVFVRDRAEHSRRRRNGAGLGPLPRLPDLHNLDEYRAVRPFTAAGCGRHYLYGSGPLRRQNATFEDDGSYSVLVAAAAAHAKIDGTHTDRRREGRRAGCDERGVLLGDENMAVDAVRYDTCGE